MKSLRANPYPSKEKQSQLAMSLNTSEEVIKFWFENSRRRKDNMRASE